MLFGGMGMIGIVIGGGISGIVGGVINASINIYSAFGTGSLNVLWEGCKGYLWGGLYGCLIFEGLFIPARIVYLCTQYLMYRFIKNR